MADCKVECHYCREVFIVSSLDTPLPEHRHQDRFCPGSGQTGHLLSVHFTRQKL